jgi:molybdenum cofactor cytidylyltransferase
VESHDVQSTLTGALRIAGPQLVAFAGAGGKTTALQQSCRELALQGTRALATTTTAMFARQLAATGPLLVEDDDSVPLSARAAEALRTAEVVALAKSRTGHEKVKGLTPDEVDALWHRGLTGSLLVEADGSRGLPLKAFGEAEPQLPSWTSTVVVVAGLQALDRPLDEDHVHRAGLLAQRLRVPTGTLVTPDLLGRALALQAGRVRELAPGARVVVLLNQAESDALLDQAVQAGAQVLAGAPGAPANEDRGADRVVIGSLHQGAYRVLGERSEAPGPSSTAPVPGDVRALGVVLAAGLATRMGGSKVVRPVEGRAMVERVVDASLTSRLADTVVVVGHDAEGVRAVLGSRGVRVIDNPHHAEGLSTSVRAALQGAGGAYEAALFLLADQPFVTAALIDQLLAAFVSSGKPIVRPWIDGKPGNPVLFAASLFPELLRESGDRGGREVVRRHEDRVCLVEVDDPRVGLDIDTLEDYERLRTG